MQPNIGTLTNGSNHVLLRPAATKSSRNVETHGAFVQVALKVSHSVIVFRRSAFFSFDTGSVLSDGCR
jgi:hypothetical protein